MATTWPNCPPDCFYRNWTYDRCPDHDAESAAAERLEEDIQRARWVRRSWFTLRLPRFVGVQLAKKERYWDEKRDKWRYRW